MLCGCIPAIQLRQLLAMVRIGFKRWNRLQELSHSDKSTHSSLLQNVFNKVLISDRPESMLCGRIPSIQWIELSNCRNNNGGTLLERRGTSFSPDNCWPLINEVEWSYRIRLYWSIQEEITSYIHSKELQKRNIPKQIPEKMADSSRLDSRQNNEYSNEISLLISLTKKNFTIHFVD